MTDSSPKTQLPRWVKPAVLIPMLIGLPLLGVWLQGAELGSYLQVPPLTRVVEHAAFSLPVFAGMALLIVGVIAPFLVRLARAGSGPVESPTRRFPWWGWAGLALGAVSWVLAWTRFAWFSAGQLHTFSPLWLAYILVISALTWRRTGRCLMTHQTGFFLALFPVSAGFWWFFEYLNRFVENWYYTGGVMELSGGQYIVFASVAFATVLPAVLGTKEWLDSFGRFERAFGAWRPVPALRHRGVGVMLLSVSALGLAGLGRWPELLYPLVWVSPVVILLGLQAVAGEKGLLHELAAGRWRDLVTAAVAALICGFFWELWNWGSLARWVYSIPFVHKAQLFEMPLLGYAWYLPFGVECLVIGRWMRSGLAPAPIEARDPAAVQSAYPAGV